MSSFFRWSTEEKLAIDGVLWSDETIFKLNGYINRHKCVYLASESSKVAIDLHVYFSGVFGASFYQKASFARPFST